MTKSAIVLDIAVEPPVEPLDDFAYIRGIRCKIDTNGKLIRLFNARYAAL